MTGLCKHLSLCLLLICMISFRMQAAESPAADSLKQLLRVAGTDTSRIHILHELTKTFSDEQKYDSSLVYCNQAIRLSENINYRKGLAIAFTDRGVIFNDKENYSEAIENFQSAREAYEEIGDKKNTADSYNLIANAFHLLGDYTNALKNQFAALKIRESIHDEEGIAWSYNNIGTIYRLQGDYKSALENYTFALKLLTKFNDKKMMAKGYSNIGNVYTLQGNHTEALASYYASLKLRLQADDKKDIAASYLNIGDAYCDLYEKDSLTKEVKVESPDGRVYTIPREHWLDTALSIQLVAQKLINEFANNYYEIFNLSGIGRINLLKKNYHASINLYLKAYTIADELKAVDLQKEIAEYLAENYEHLNDPANSKKWYMKFVAHKDTLFNQLKIDELTRTQLKYEFDKKEGEAKAVQDKKDAIAKIELIRQKKVRTLFQGGFVLVLLFAGVFLYQRNHIRREKNRSDDLLLNILPSEVANELKQTGASGTRSFSDVTVMFADFVDFTHISEKLSPELLVTELHTCFSAFDNILQKHKVEKIKTIGDAYLCAGGLPVPDPDHAINIVNASVEIMKYMQERRLIKESKNEIPFQLRIGIHTGPVVAGIVGVKKYAYDIWGDTVNIAARMEQSSLPGKINISSKTHELIKDKFNCTYRGKIEAKNKGQIDMYFLEDRVDA
jgi:adenylate cyclase